MRPGVGWGGKRTSTETEGEKVEIKMESRGDKEKKSDMK